MSLLQNLYNFLVFWQLKLWLFVAFRSCGPRCKGQSFTGCCSSAAETQLWYNCVFAQSSCQVVSLFSVIQVDVFNTLVHRYVLPTFW